MGCNCECCRCGGDITGLSHIGVFIRDIDKSLDYYTNTLGFECYYRADVGEAEKTRIAFLRQGTCIIELVQRPVSEQRGDGLVDHIALKVTGIEAVIEGLREKGVEFETEKPIELPGLLGGGVKYITFRGPDGEHLELTEELKVAPKLRECL